MGFEGLSESFADILMQDLALREADDACMGDRDEIEIEGLSDSCEVAIDNLFMQIYNAIPEKLWNHFGKLCSQDERLDFGHSVYLSVVGHGTGVWDMQIPGDKEYKLARLIDSYVTDIESMAEFYVGDDGKVYWFTKEHLA